MHWLTILTALLYSAMLAFQAFVKGWELTHAALLVFGLAFAVVLAIVVAVMMMPKEEGKSFGKASGRQLRQNCWG